VKGQENTLSWDRGGGIEVEALRCGTGTQFQCVVAVSVNVK
jgi:hypothetical protein